MATNKNNILFITILVIIVLLLFIFIIPTTNTIEGLNKNEFIPTNNTQLFTQPIPLKSNMGVTFTMKLNSGYNGNWQQILGVTPYQNGSDKRIFGAWLCPWSNTVHFRTATMSNDNDNISDCNVQVPVNQYIRFDILFNLNSDANTQHILAYQTNTSVKNSAANKVAEVNLNRPYYSPRNGYNQSWVQTTYNNWGTFNGTLTDVAVITGDDPISITNLQNATNYNASINGFTTMSDGKEGLTNIGGIGSNGGIPYVAPVTPAIPTQPPKNYTAVKDSNGKDLCTTSVVQVGDANLGLISSNGYNYNVNIGSDMKTKGSVPICSPDDLYLVQNQILKELNNFNSEYSDYMTYRYNMKHSVAGDTSQPLNYQDGGKDNAPYSDKFKNIKDVRDLPTYKQLNIDLQTYGNLLTANQKYYPDPETKDPNSGLSNLDPINLDFKHNDIVKMRNDLDAKLFELNNVQGSVAGSSKMEMDGSIYATILWTTLATSLVYFIFIQM
jgi:hypothetical protein